MGDSPQPFLVSLDLLGNKGRCNSSKPSWTKVSEAQARRRKQGSKVKTKMAWMKRRTPLEGSRNGVERKVRTLKKLVPNSETMGLDGLFRETADYILCLQMRVKAMQAMVKVLSGSDEY